MDDIRSRRYKLNKVIFRHERDVKDEIGRDDDDESTDEDDKEVGQVPLAMPQRVKREAHDVILDFIRSRPPLKPVRKFSLFF